MLDQTRIDALRANNLNDRQLFINGKFQASLSGKTVDVISPVDGEKITTLSDASSEDVNLAVKSARKAFD